MSVAGPFSSQTPPVSVVLRVAATTGPLGSGLATAVGMALAGVGLGLAAALGAGFFGAVLVYLIAASGYSLWAKDKLIVDVLVLAGLYTLRIIAGAYAIGVRSGLSHERLCEAGAKATIADYTDASLPTLLDRLRGESIP